MEYAIALNFLASNKIEAKDLTLTDCSNHHKIINCFGDIKVNGEDLDNKLLCYRSSEHNLNVYLLDSVVIAVFYKQVITWTSINNREKLREYLLNRSLDFILSTINFGF